MLAAIIPSLEHLLCLLLGFGCLGILAIWHRPRRGVPNLPILSVTGESGSAGIRKDVQAYVRNGSEVVQRGYDQVGTKQYGMIQRVITN